MQAMLKRGMAILVIFAFGWMLIVSSVPLRAAKAPRSPSSENSTYHDAPGLIEQSVPQEYKVKRSSPVILILVGVVLVGGIAAVLILVVFKTKYTIVGDWDLTYTWTGKDPGTATVTFSGTKTEGTFIMHWTTKTYTGTYRASGKSVEFVFTGSGTTYKGEFENKDLIRGTMTSSVVGYESGTWVANRMTSSSIARAQAVGRQPGATPPAR